MAELEGEASQVGFVEEPRFSLPDHEDDDGEEEEGEESSSSSSSEGGLGAPLADARPKPPARTRKISFPVEALFQSAILEGDNAELWRLLSRHGHLLDVDASNHAGVTPLHHAALHNNLDSAKMLLGAGCDVGAADGYGYTALHTAAACGHTALASLLLLHGADVFAQTHEGDLAADLAKDTALGRLLQDEMVGRLQQEEIDRRREEDSVSTLLSACLRALISLFVWMLKGTLVRVRKKLE